MFAAKRAGLMSLQTLNLICQEIVSMMESVIPLAGFGLVQWILTKKLMPEAFICWIPTRVSPRK
jgi:hypothetical protein